VVVLVDEANLKLMNIVRISSRLGQGGGHHRELIIPECQMMTANHHVTRELDESIEDATRVTSQIYWVSYNINIELNKYVIIYLLISRQSVKHISPRKYINI
jgi:hypothetical protein